MEDKLQLVVDPSLLRPPGGEIPAPAAAPLHIVS